MRILLLIVLETVITGQLFSQTQTWTLQNCIEYGVRRSIDIQRQLLANRGESLDLRDAYFNLLPSVGGSSSAQYNYGRNVDPESNTYINTRTRSVSFSVGASLNIFSGFSAVNKVRYSKMAELKGLKNSEKMANDVAVEIMQNYFDLAYTEGLIAISEEQVKNAETQLKRTRRQYELGMKPKSDLYDIEGLLAECEFNLVSSRNKREVALLSLRQAMNLPEDSVLTIRVSEFENIITNETSFSLDSLSRTLCLRAESTLPELLSADYAVREAKFKRNLNRGNLYPSLSVYGETYSYYNPKLEAVFEKQLDNNLGKNFGFTLKIPVFYGLQRQTLLSKAKLEYTDAIYARRQALDKVYKEIKLALQELQSAVAEYTVAAKREDFYRLSAEAGQKKYEQGITSVIEMNTAVNNYLNAQNDLLKARLTYVIKRRMVDFYMGAPLQTEVVF